MLVGLGVIVVPSCSRWPRPRWAVVGGLDPGESVLSGRAARGPISADDLDSVRFAVGFRGYRMDQVDDVLNVSAASSPNEMRASATRRRHAVGGVDGPCRER